MPKASSFFPSLAALALMASVALAQAEALSTDTVGASPQTVTPPGSFAFSVDGDVKLGGFVFKGSYPFLHNDGGQTARNTAVGLNALVSSTPNTPYSFSGETNTASGAYALQYNTSGASNTANGAFALRFNTTGSQNTASGEEALKANTTGTGNTASGTFALVNNTTGYSNTAIGLGALYSSVGGRRNIALGYSSGSNNASGSDNIWIGSFGADESHTLRLGAATGTGFFEQDRAFIAGIANATGGTFSQDVCVDPSTDQLGPCVGPAAFPEDAEDLGDASGALAALRAVKFRDTVKSAGEPDPPVHYGLIAAEVAEALPELVSYSRDGSPARVKYEELTPLLVNELQRQRAVIEAQQAEVAEQTAEIQRLRGLEREVAALRARQSQFDEITARLARLEALAKRREPPALVASR